MSNKLKKTNKNKVQKKPETAKENFLKEHPIFNKIYSSLNAENSTKNKSVKVVNNIFSTIFVSFILIALFLKSEYKTIGLISGIFFTIANSILPLRYVIKNNNRTENIILISVNSVFFIAFLLLLIF